MAGGSGSERWQALLSTHEAFLTEVIGGFISALLHFGAENISSCDRESKGSGAEAFGGVVLGVLHAILEDQLLTGLNTSQENATPRHFSSSISSLESSAVATLSVLCLCSSQCAHGAEKAQVSMVHHYHRLVVGMRLDAVAVQTALSLFPKVERAEHEVSPV